LHFQKESSYLANLLPNYIVACLSWIVRPVQARQLVPAMDG
jgi:hypothetical protein